MAASPVTVEDFRGLRLLPEQGEAGGAVSMLNADFTRGPTQVGTRGGLVTLGTGTASYHRIAPLSSTQLVAFRNTGSAVSLQEVTLSSGVFGPAGTWGSASTLVTSVVAMDGSLLICSRAGATNESTKAYLASSDTLTNLVPAAAGRYVAITPGDQRTVMAHFTSAAGSPTGANGTTSTVFFSDPGTALTWGSTNWVQLDPNDGDEITGIATWRDLLFVLKEQAMYVFYSTSIDTTGNPIFNYRKMTLPARVRATHDLGGENIVAGGDGIYLLLADGVYRTTGDTPQMVSRDIAPVFNGTSDGSMVFPSTAGSNWSLGYAANRVYLSYGVGSSFRTLVYDALLGEWLFWDLTAGASSRPTNVIEWLDANGYPTAYVASGAKMLSFSQTATDDGGTAIVSSYQSGFDALGYSTQEKQIRNVELVGTGTPTLTVLTDYATSDPLSRAATVTLGTAPAVAGATHAKSYSGRLFSFMVSATSGSWSVARVTYNVRSVRPAGLRSAA